MTNANIYSSSGELKKANLKNRESSFSTTNKHNSADLSDKFCFRGAKNYKGKFCRNVGKSKSSLSSQDLLCSRIIKQRQQNNLTRFGL